MSTFVLMYFSEFAEFTRKMSPENLRHKIQTIRDTDITTRVCIPNKSVSDLHIANKSRGFHKLSNSDAVWLAVMELTEIIDVLKSAGINSIGELREKLK